MAIVYVDDFLTSTLRPEVLYELLIRLGLAISEVQFRSAITQLNVQFVSPRVAFSARLEDKKITVFYSISDWQPAISQQEVVFGLMNAFTNFSPSILYEESPGEIPQGVPLIPEVTEPRALLSPEWIPEFFTYMKEEVKEVAKDIVDEIEKLTGWPRWAIPYILGAGAISVILLVLYIKTKPLLVIKTKESR